MVGAYFGAKEIDIFADLLLTASSGPFEVVDGVVHIIGQHVDARLASHEPDLPAAQHVPSLAVLQLMSCLRTLLPLPHAYTVTFSFSTLTPRSLMRRAVTSHALPGSSNSAIDVEYF